MLLQTSCELSFSITEPTPFVFLLRPRSGPHQWVCAERFSFLPTISAVEYSDIYGNRCQRLTAPAGDFTVSTSAEVLTSTALLRNPGGPFVEIPKLPDRVLQYLLPSRYCESEYFSQMALEITAGLEPGYNQVAAIESWIRDEIRYDCEGSDIPVSATEVNRRRTGVCKDLAHLGMALCRAVCIPARLVVGYLHGLEPMDLHAWFEAYVADNWYTFDPTQDGSKSGYVVLGYGRDAADVAVYNQFGPAVYPTWKQVKVIRKR